MQPQALLSLLQFTDGLFPSGGYSHSFGLESYVQAGLIKDTRGVATFLSSYLEGTVGPVDAMAVVSTLNCGSVNDLEGCFTLDATLDAMKTVAEFRQASREMGRQTLRTAVELTHHPLLISFLSKVDVQQTAGHHPVTFGLIGSVYGWDSHDAAAAYLYASASLVIGASLRLLPIGQTEGQRLLASVAPLITRLADQAALSCTDDLWNFAPGIEIAGMRHTYLDARMFRS